MPNHNAVPGILTPGEIDGKMVSLAPYFSGALASTNTGGSSGSSVNFLDGGGAGKYIPLLFPKCMSLSRTCANKLHRAVEEEHGCKRHQEPPIVRISRLFILLRR